jgi:hypothetical protein
MKRIVKVKKGTSKLKSVKQVLQIKTENNAEILLIKIYYAIISILLGYDSYTKLEEYIKKIKYEIQVNGNEINITNVINALSKLGIFNLGFFFLDIYNLQELIADTIRILKLKNNKTELQNLSHDMTIRYIMSKFMRLRKS